MIYLIGNAPESTRYRRYHLWMLLKWLALQDEYQLDLETNVTEWWCDKKIMAIQFGDVNGTDQYVVQWSFLKDEEKAAIKEILEDNSKIKLIHNAMFECVVLLFHGIRIENVYDTMLAEMVMNTGMDYVTEDADDDDKDETDVTAGFYALTSLSDRYLCKRMDKSSQMLFGDDVLTEAKVIYAAADVQPLGAIRRMQLPMISHLDLDYVVALENAVVPGFAEMTHTGMPLNVEKWRENIQLAVPVIAEAKARADAFLGEEPFWRRAMDLGFYDMEDRITINWNSPVQKKKIVEHYFPFLVGRVGKPVLAKMLRNALFSDSKGREIVQAFYDEDWAILNTILLEADRMWLIDNDLMIPGGTGSINWNSQQQAIEMLRCVKKNLANTNAETMSKFTHPIGKALTDYRSALKLISTYGEKFIQKYVDPEGKIRSSVRQVKSTGRIGSYRPNMQNIIVDESVGTRYRNAFECDKGFEYVSSDFSGQELVLMTHMSQEPVFLDAIRKGQDLHSICAELIFKKRWSDATGTGCLYYKLVDGKPLHKKCECKAHKVMRTNAKTLNFGLPYGMSEYKLAGMLGISVSEAKAIMNEHERTFPKLWAMLRYLRRFGITRGYIQTLAPFFRKRWFPYWRLVRHLVPEHIAGIQYNPTLGSIEREAGNMPIQGSGADITKLAIVLMYDHIHNGPEDISDRVKLAMQVHDQVDTHTRKDYSDTWLPVMHNFMLEAALVVVPSGMLGADTAKSPVWTK